MTLVLFMAPFFAKAQQQERESLSLIRDAEIEDTLRAYTDPIFQAAGLGDINVQVFIINDGRINAFVAGGRYMFINTGTLIEADKPSQVIGVLAHETGHLVGGHVYRLRERMQEAQIIALISMLLSAAAGAAAGDGSAVAAGTLAGQRMAMGHLFAYAQSQERAADQYAVEILDRLGISSLGLLEFFEKMRGQEALMTARQDPYLRTHPLTEDRIAFMRRHVERSEYSDARMPDRFQRMHERMRGKLIGFLQPPAQVIQRYANDTGTLEARYALAVAYHRNGQLPQALEYVNSLVNQDPEDAYFLDLKGQILFESGRIDQAVEVYGRAVELKPHSPLLRAAMGHALVESGRPDADRQAISHLREAVRRDPFIVKAWRLLAVAYGREGDIGRSSLALAEYYALLRDKGALQRSILRAEEHLREGTPAWQRLQDLKAVSNRNDDGG